MSATSHRRKMFVFTDQYPWGRGEKSFIEPELSALNARYDITIISSAPDRDFNDAGNESEPVDDIEAIHWNWPSLLVFGLHALGFFFSKIAWSEFGRICKEGFTVGRLLDSIKAYGVSHALRSFYRRTGLFDEPDALYYSVWFGHQLLALAFEKRKRSFNLISRIHGYDLYSARNPHGRQPFQWFKKEMADLVVFASSNAMGCFEEEFGPEDYSGQYVVSRLGVSQQEAGNRRNQGGKKLVVSCSNVIPLKRVDMIARAIGESSHKADIRWVHFGDGDGLDDVRSLADSYGLDAAFLGYTKNDAIIQFYKDNRVDAVMLLSETEGGCPICFQEALSFGIPLIGTDVGGVGEEIDGNGILLEPNPLLADVVEAIEDVCFGDEMQTVRMRERSFELWDARFDVQKNKRHFIEILEQRFG